MLDLISKLRDKFDCNKILFIEGAKLPFLYYSIVRYHPEGRRQMEGGHHLCIKPS